MIEIGPGPRRRLGRAAVEVTPRIFCNQLPFQPAFDFSYDASMRSLGDSLERLGMNRVDVLLIHDADEWSQGEGCAQALKTVEAGALRALTHQARR